MLTDAGITVTSPPAPVERVATAQERLRALGD